MNRFRDRTTLNYIYLLMILVTVYCYWPGLSGFFVVDDHWNIEQNAKIRMESFDFLSIKLAILSGESGPLKRPVAMLSFALNYYFTGLDPFWMKFTNLVIHLFNSFILLLLMKRMFFSLVKRYGQKYESISIPYLIAVAWLLHPINVTAVSYIVQRMTSLASTFMLLTILLYMMVRSRELATPKGYLLTFLMFLCWLAGLFTKEIAVLTGLVVLSIDYLVFKFEVNSVREKTHLKLIIAGLCLPVLLGFAFVLLNFQEYLIDKYVVRDFTAWERLLSESRILIKYVLLIIFPDVSNMGIYQDGMILSKSLFHPVTTIFSILIISFSILLAWKIRVDFPLASLGILWFYSMHLLESTVIPLELVFLHRNYLALIGVLLIATEILVYLSAKNKKSVFIILALYFLIFSSVTRSLAWNWSDDMAHLIVEAQNYPASQRANSAAGMLYFIAASKVEEGDDKEILTAKSHEYFEKAFELQPNIGISNDMWMLKNSAKSGLEIPEKLVERIIERIKISVVSYELLKGLEALNLCLEQELCSLDKRDLRRILDAVSNMQFYSKSYEAFYYNIYASYLFNIEMDYENAIKMQKTAVSIFPELPDHYANLFIYYRQIPDIHNMESTLGKLISRDKFALFEENINAFKQDLVDARIFMENIELHKKEYRNNQFNDGKTEDE